MLGSMHTDPGDCFLNVWYVAVGKATELYLSSSVLSSIPIDRFEQGIEGFCIR